MKKSSVHTSCILMKVQVSSVRKPWRWWWLDCQGPNSEKRWRNQSAFRILLVLWILKRGGCNREFKSSWSDYVTLYSINGISMITSDTLVQQWSYGISILFVLYTRLKLKRAAEMYVSVTYYLITNTKNYFHQKKINKQNTTF